MMVTRGVGALIATVLVACVSISARADDIALRIVDEHGIVVPAANITLSWQERNFVNLITDTEGRAKAEGDRPHNQVELRIEAPGYYTTTASVPMPAHCRHGKCLIGTQDELTLVLKRKLKPVAMYHYNVRATSPNPSQPIGFDLLKGDWVKPYGQGEMSDLTFTSSCAIRNVQRFTAATYPEANEAARQAIPKSIYYVAVREVTNGQSKLRAISRVGESKLPNPVIDNGFELFVAHRADVGCQNEIRFINPNDGLQFRPVFPDGLPSWLTYRSELESEHLAPESGYKAVWVPDRESDEPHIKRRAWVGYLRIRSQTDAAGNVVSALYGKVYDATPNFIRAERLVLDYYINPDGTRHVEFDPERNLGRDHTLKH